jgi:hypothetical protein
MKRLRSTHRRLFTHHVEDEVKKDVWVRRRVKNTNYVPFRQWLRSLDFMDVHGILSDKAQKIRKSVIN